MVDGWGLMVDGNNQLSTINLQPYKSAYTNPQMLSPLF